MVIRALPNRMLFKPVIVFSVGLFLCSCAKKSQTDPIPVISSSITVVNFAGSGMAGFADGARDAASFFMPSVLAVDEAGNIYVSDTGNALIRRISPSGDVKTYAGTVGVHNSLLGYPYGLAADAAGNIYVGDVYRSRILKISPQSIISILAGSGYAGFTDGPAATASFNQPYGLAVDAAGNIYVADSGNNAIRKITPDGMVSTLAGNGAAGDDDGKGAQASFFSPYGITTDAAGNIIVADTYNQLIRKITPDGTVSTIAGGGSPGSAKPGYFGAPFGVTADASGNLYVADFGVNQVRKVDPNGAVTVVAGSGQQGAANGPGVYAAFNGPSGIAGDASGNIFVADYRNNLIRKILIKK